MKEVKKNNGGKSRGGRENGRGENHFTNEKEAFFILLRRGGKLPKLS
jgi:hypothetical protein